MLGKGNVGEDGGQGEEERGCRDEDSREDNRGDFLAFCVFVDFISFFLSDNSKILSVTNFLFLSV